MSTSQKFCSGSPSELVGNLSSLTDLLRLRAEGQPEQSAYAFLVNGEPEQHMTYAELDWQARAIAAWLQSYGAEGERVLLLYPPGLSYIAAFFGCVYAGGVAIPAYPPRLNHSLRRLQAIVADAEAKFVLTTKPILSRMAAFVEYAPYLKSMRWLATDQLEMTSALVESWKQPRANHETLAFLQYTSGSTATPKGVMVSHGNVLHTSADLSAGWEDPPHTVPLSWLPHFHDMGLIEGIIQPLFNGFSALLMSPASFLQRPLNWLEAITRYGVTHSGGPNFAYDLCVRRTNPEQRAKLDLSSWHLAYNGAEPIRAETLERFAEAFSVCGFRPEAFNAGYGMAEATLKVTTGWRADPPIISAVRANALEQHRVVEASAGESGARRLVGCGHVGLKTRVRIVHPQTLVECAPEEVGEIWVSGPGVALGYWKKDEETFKTFHATLAGTDSPQFLRTGDLGFLKDEELFVTGRLKDLIIINGYNHYPQDIERTVEQCEPSLRAGCCAAFSLEVNGKEELVIVAEVEPHSMPSAREAERIFGAIRRVVAEQHDLETHSVLLLKAGKIPKTSSGKLQRYACREGFLNDTLEVVAQWPAAPLESASSDGALQREPEERSASQSKDYLPDGHRTADVIQSWLIKKLASVSHIEPKEIDVSQPFVSFGLGSLQSVGLSGELAEWLGHPLPPTLLYEYPTISALSRFLAGEPRASDREKKQPQSLSVDATVLAEPIAIIGIGCRFPGADNAEAFWRSLQAGVDAITEYPQERWQMSHLGLSGQAQTEGLKHFNGGFLPRVDEFDAQFFSISPLEAPLIDPQQRLLLEVAWEALEDAGQSPAKLAGSQTGVFIGISSSDYYLLRQSASNDYAPYSTTGNSHSIAANRLSYLLDLHGPSLAIDTACSSSLVAVHMASESLRRGESTLALAGGVNLILNPNVTDELARAGMLAADGRCKVFDAEADGYVRAEGGGIVILKRLSDALRDGDRIIAQLKASAINQDGRSNGLTAPSGPAQQSVIRQALENARLAPAEIDFVETHGSGTSLGDPIEVNSLINVLGEGRSSEQACYLGSVKANIGHLEAAAGVAGLIKAALSLSHALIPPQLHLKRINPHLDIQNTPFSIATEPKPWPLSSRPKRAGVSSFGFGGTNAHVILEEAPPTAQAEVETERPLHLLALSARSRTALWTLAHRYTSFLKEHTNIALPDICFTANTGRSHFSHRLAILCDSHRQCLEKLEAFIEGREVSGMYYGSQHNQQRPKGASVFADEKVSDTIWHRLSVQKEDWPALLSTLAELYASGVEVDWERFDEQYQRRRVPLPTYPFERRRYWLDAAQDSLSGEDMSQIRQPAGMNENLSAQELQDNGRRQPAAASLSLNQTSTEELPAEARKQEVLHTLSGIVAGLLHMRANEVDTRAPFLEMGADSIVLVTAVRTIENSFGVKISIRQLFEDLTTIEALASHIAQHAPASADKNEASYSVPNVPAPMAARASSAPTVNERADEEEADEHQSISGSANERSDSISESAPERLARMQLEAFSRLTAQQWEFLGQGVSEAPAPSVRPEGAADKRKESVAPLNETIHPSDDEQQVELSTSLKTVDAGSGTGVETGASLVASAPYVPYKRIMPGANGGLSSRQAQHLEALIARFTNRTRKSKLLAEQARAALADSRASVGFRLSIKEMLYPIVGARSSGSKIWDIDGNEYLDVTMGFGVHLFGHGAPFIQQALAEQLREGIQLGPRAQSVSDVAQLICELTGHERVAFCNSGTEAVMTALRLARAFTGRSRIAIFAGSYHGHSDGTLAIAEHRDGAQASVPMAPGVMQKVVDDVLVLEYGSPQSLGYLKAHAHELACVLVEPVQSRNPGLQPRAFLQELREITKAAGTALIFDEMVTGFRIHPGGAQAWFGVKADLATYGKIIGGGMPIGVVAGHADYMNGIDGGMWTYGDASYPKAETTFFGGTFCMHPLTMAAALATLKHLKQEGPDLQQRLNMRTSQLAENLNAYFAENEIPLRMANFGSLFRFVHSGNMDLFYYHLLEKGVYIWEWRSGFLSTAHTEQDLDFLARSIKDSASEMLEGGFLPERSSTRSIGQTTSELEKSHAVSGRAALSDAQKQLWLLAQMGEDASLAYHESVIVELQGPLDLDHLHEAFLTVFNHHEALRTAIESDGQWQQIQGSLEIELPLIDFTGTESSERQAAIDGWLKREGHRPFDLTQPPLLRVYALKVEEGKHLLVLIAHHIVIDSWSLSLILGEVASLYTARVENTPCDLPRPMQFTEYLRELSSPDYLQRLEQVEDYWRGQFNCPTPSLSLAASRPHVKKYLGSKVSARLKVQLCDRLKAYSRQRGCTLFMTLFAGYTALLHRLTGQDEVVVGIPVTGRFITGSEAVVGYCTHLLPIICRLDESSSFDEHLRSNRSALLGAYEHQEYPFAKLIYLLNPERDLSRTPIIQTTFNLEPNAVLPEFAHLDASLVSSPVSYTKFDISVNVIDIDGELRVDFDYDTELFDAAFVGHMAEQYVMLLESALTHQAEPLSAFSLVTEDERQRLLVEWNDTAASFPGTACVHELVEGEARRTPQRVAVRFNEQRLTYQELNRRANQLAHHLRSLGLGSEARVAVCVERSPEMMIALLGILKAGCAYVPLDPEYPQKRLAYMLEDSQASLLLTGQRLAGLLAQDTIRTLELDTLWPIIKDGNEENPAKRTTADNLAYVIYTSGSTGRPKGVQITHGAVVNLLSSVELLPGMTGEDALLAVTTVSFDIAALELFLPLIVGGCLVIASREEARDGERLSQLLSENEITIMQATPATWRLLIEAGWQGSERLKILCGGEALPEKLAAELLLRGASLWNMYGPTETTIWSVTGRIEPRRSGCPISIGKPIANTQTYVLDAQLQPVPVGVVGELYIGGNGLARGYLNRPQITAEKFIPHPFSDKPGMRLYRTGDLARYLQDGRIELLGRVDQQVKVRGFRIELGEIEAALTNHPRVREVVVAVRENQDDDQRLVAYVVSDGDQAPATSELSVFLSQSLPEYMVPSGFVFLAALPRHPNGKVNRGALPEHNGTPNLHTHMNVAMPQTELEQSIASIWKEILRVESVGLYDNFFDIGGHSLLLAQVHRKLKGVAGKEFSLIEMFRHPTVSALAGYLNNGQSVAAPAHVAPLPLSRSRHATASAETDVAIIGMAGRFPGARSIEEFWSNLRGGVESITFFNRQELEAQGVPSALLNDPGYVSAGAFLDDIELFDAKFFGFSPREAEVTDPQHRVFLECAWEALENAGYDSEKFKGAIGVYASVGLNTYLLFNIAGRDDLLATHSAYQTFIGNDKDFVPSRVSYKLNLKGPSINVQTACSSSLVGVHMACQSLLNGECDIAMAGGVAVKVPHKTGYLHDEQGIDSPDGHCRAFDAQARGTVFGSGVGIVVLKRLTEALRDGDYIHAVIKGSAVNNDGSHKISYTAPSVDGQAEVIQTALAVAQVEPQSISYIETHGTGTQLGDPVEIAALAQAFQQNGSAKSHCAIGSVKTNIGHLDTAAGIAGLIKTVLALKHRELPPSLHFTAPNPQINFADTPFYVNDCVREWVKNGAPLRAGVSSFGIGGTNAHVIIEEAPATPPSSASRPWQLLTLSAKTASALDKATADLVAYLRRHTDLSLADVAYTLQVGRRSFNERRVVICRDAQDAIASIERLDAKRVITQSAESHSREIAFLFPGQGTQYVSMARELYESEPRFRETVDACSEMLEAHLGLDLRRVLYPLDEERERAAEQLKQTRLAQPALFVIEYALASLWMEWGIKPQAMLGHSIGEYTAACLAGLFSLEDGLALVAARGRLMQSLPGGAMLAVGLAEDEALSLLNEQLSLAAVNGASQCVISGEAVAVDQLEKGLIGRGVVCTRLQTSHAFHSAMMEPSMERFVKEVERVPFKTPTIPWLSNLTGDWISAEEAMNPRYWARQLRETVRFSDGLGKLLSRPERILLEVGPGQSLSAQVRRHPFKQPTQAVISSMRHSQDHNSDVALLLTALGRLWLAGCEINWAAFNAHEQRRRIPLPTYPFERERYWIDPPKRERGDSQTLPSLHKRAELSQWFYLPCWKPGAPLRAHSPEENPARTGYLVFINDSAFCLNFLKRFEEQANAVLVTVKAGERFTKLNAAAYVLNPLRAGDYQRLIEDLRLGGRLPSKLLHFWNVSADNEMPGASTCFNDYQRTGFESLIHLGKALGETGEAVEMIVVSNGLQSIGGAEELCPEKATLLGPCKTIPQEYMHLTCRSLDLVLPAPESWQEKQLIEQLVAEMEAKTSDTVVAYRNGSRWVQAFEPTLFSAPGLNNRIHLREGGVYLITGGLGRIGLSLADYLTAATYGKLALIARSPFPARDNWNEWLEAHDDGDETSRKIRRLRALEEKGAEVRVFNADVTDEERMQQVVNRVEEELGEIKGVIHAAGIVPEKTFQLIRDTSDLTLGWLKNPKLQGLVVLERVLRGRKIDFCLLMSSLASVLGGLGYTTYCAANLFMDAFAHRQNRLGPVPWISVNWDAWLFEDEQQEKGVGASLAELSMTAKEGIEVFGRLLATTPVAQVVISTADLQKRIDRWINLESRASVREKPEPDRLHPRPELATTYAAPSTETERAIVRIWQQLLGVEQIGIHDNFFALGGESLLAIQLTSRIRAAFQVEIGPRDLFESPTVAALSSIVTTKRASEEAIKIQPLLRAAESSAPMLSFAQQQVWVVSQLRRGETAYNVPTATILRGRLDTSALEQSLSEIVRRHETLRICFPTADGRPLPVITPAWDVILPLIDIKELPSEERLSRAQSLAYEEAQKPFDLSRGPLFRAVLVRTHDEEHVLLLTMHHIVTDGWSMGILIAELAALYEAYSNGAPSPLPELSIQYSDFAVWQRETLKGKRRESLVAYWKERLGENLPRLELPADKPRSAIQSFRGATLYVRLSPELTESLKALGQEEKATLFMTLLAAFKVLLHCHTGESRIVVGTDVANRQRPEVEGLIGFFVNQLVLLTDLSGNPDFKSLLARVRETALGAFTHQELPFEMLIDVLKPEREATDSPLFQVKFVLQNAPQPPLHLSSLSLSPIEVENPYAKFDLLLTLWESEDGLRGTFEYRAELFDSSTIEEMLRDYETILTAVVAEPSINLSALRALLDEAKRERNLAREREVKDTAQMRLKNVRRKPVSANNNGKET